MTVEELREALKHEDGPWGNAVDVAYLLLLRGCLMCLDGELCQIFGGALTEEVAERKWMVRRSEGDVTLVSIPQYSHFRPFDES